MKTSEEEFRILFTTHQAIIPSWFDASLQQYLTFPTPIILARSRSNQNGKFLSTFEVILKTLMNSGCLDVNFRHNTLP